MFDVTSNWCIHKFDCTFLSRAYLNIISIFSPGIFVFLACIIMETMPSVDTSVNCIFHILLFPLQQPLSNWFKCITLSYLGLVIPCLSVNGCYEQEMAHYCFPHVLHNNSKTTTLWLLYGTQWKIHNVLLLKITSYTVLLGCGLLDLWEVLVWKQCGIYLFMKTKCRRYTDWVEIETTCDQALSVRSYCLRGKTFFIVNLAAVCNLIFWKVISHRFILSCVQCVMCLTTIL